ncbi:MAG TPA: hypothetical protein VG651_16835 [Stellaceae bacterium]|nr:hypothetical protein [Stellaceae bacterium]
MQCRVGAEREGGFQIEPLVAAVASRHGDDADARFELTQRPHGFDAFHARHDDIGDDQVEMLRVELVERVAPVPGERREMTGALEDTSNRGTNALFIIDHQNASHGNSLSKLQL